MTNFHHYLLCCLCRRYCGSAACTFVVGYADLTGHREGWLGVASDSSDYDSGFGSAIFIDSASSVHLEGLLATSFIVIFRSTRYYLCSCDSSQRLERSFDAKVAGSCYAEDASTAIRNCCTDSDLDLEMCRITQARGAFLGDVATVPSRTVVDCYDPSLKVSFGWALSGYYHYRSSHLGASKVAVVAASFGARSCCLAESLRSCCC